MTPTPVFKKLTPNLLVADVQRSVAFYVDVLYFSEGMTVPDAPPYVFASVFSNGVEIFFNEKETAAKEYPAFAGKPIGCTGTMFIELDGAGGIELLYDRLKAVVPVRMPLVTQWYGVKEFAIADPDGYVITFAERVGADPASA